VSDVVKPGVETTEYTMAKFVAIAGAIVTAAGTALEALAQSGFGAPWVGIALVVVGVAMTLLNAAGYSKQRQDLKVAQMALTAENKAKEINSLESAAKVLSNYALSVKTEGQ
jgi:hypothetical protein